MPSSISSICSSIVNTVSSSTGFSGALPDGFVRVPHPKQDSSISRDSAPETARFPMYFSIYFSLSNS